MPGRPIKRTYSLRSLVIIINLAVLALPIIGLLALRIFENIVHRQTELKLIAEAAYVRSLYLDSLSVKLNKKSSIRKKIVVPAENPPPYRKDRWKPYPPRIDLSKDPVLPPGPEGLKTTEPPHPAVIRAGKEIQPILKEAQRISLSGIRVLDAHGVVVASSGGQLGENLKNRTEVKQALTGSYSSVLREREEYAVEDLGPISKASRVRIYVALPIIVDNKDIVGVAYMHRTSLTFFRDLWDKKFAIALFAIIALTLVMSLLLSYTATRPLKTLINQARRIAKGVQGGSLRVGKTAPTEAHELSASLSSMLEKLNRRFEYVEEFTRNVSHEFKTPLAGIRGAIEILKDNWNDMNDGERYRFLAMIDNDVRRMDRLVKRLTMLTRIELAATGTEVTDLAESLPSMVNRYKESGNNVELDCRLERATARISPDMAETLFTNLLDNAVIHGKGSPVMVTLREGPEVSVRDRGPGISEANLERIFERFFTTARDRGGTGLGLAMVKAIADAWEARIEVDSDEAGTEFRIILKPAPKENKKEEL